MSDEVIKPPTASDNSLATALSYIGNKIKVSFDGGCLKQDKITYTHGTIVNIHIVYELSSNLNYFDLTLENRLFRLFGAVKITKMLILISANILGLALDLMEKETFHFPVVDLVPT